MLGVLVPIYSRLSFLSNRRRCIPSAHRSPSHESRLEFMGMSHDILRAYRFG